MGGRKIAPYFAYLLKRKDELRAEGKVLTEDALSTLVSMEWNGMTAEEKSSYKDLAKTQNEKYRLARLQPPVFPQLPQTETGITAQQADTRVTKFLSVEVGFPRSEVMRFEFVSCCISPIFIERRADGNPHSSEPLIECFQQRWWPVEICLVRWNIVSGIKSVYHVIYGIRQVPQGATTILATHIFIPDNARICFDLDVIAAEVDDFMGDTNGVLVRGPRITHVTACLKDLFSHNRAIVRAAPIILDNIIVLRQLLFNEHRTQGLQVPHHKQLRDKFEMRTSNGVVRYDPQLSRNTGINCWHSNSQFCAARRTVNDVFVLLGELNRTFHTEQFEGSHVLLPGQLLPRTPHHCSQSINRTYTSQVNIPPKSSSQENICVAAQCEIPLSSPTQTNSETSTNTIEGNIETEPCPLIVSEMNTSMQLQSSSDISNNDIEQELEQVPSAEPTEDLLQKSPIDKSVTEPQIGSHFEESHETTEPYSQEDSSPQLSKTAQNRTIDTQDRNSSLASSTQAPIEDRPLNFVQLLQRTLQNITTEQKCPDVNLYNHTATTSLHQDSEFMHSARKHDISSQKISTRAVRAPRGRVARLYLRCQ